MTNLDIETFWAVVQHGTMTAAAEALYITQPTLSMRIRALEERVGTPLFRPRQGPAPYPAHRRRPEVPDAGPPLAAPAVRDGRAGGAGAARPTSRIAAHLHHQPVHPAGGVPEVSGHASAGIPVDTHPAGRGLGPGPAEPRAGLRPHRQQHRVQRASWRCTPICPGAVSAAVRAGQRLSRRGGPRRTGPRR